MIRPIAFLLLSGLAACGRSVEVAGTLAEGAEADGVWAFGGSERSAIQDDTFRIRGLEGETLDLRFTRDEDEAARMELREVPAGARIRLRDVWFEDGLAFPTRVEVEGGGVVRVNGLRLGAGGALPAELEVAATVLAASGSGDALLARAADESLPDLRVVITPGTAIRTPDGDPAGSEGLEHGDSVSVRGAIENGYVVAAELVVPRRLAVPDEPRSLGDVLIEGLERVLRGGGGEEGEGEGRKRGDGGRGERGKGRGEERGRGRGG